MRASTIAIPNLPVGNVASVVRMVEKCGGSASIAARPKDLAGFGKVILAGVGAFDYGMQCLSEGGWVDALNAAAQERRVPVLGICLGMQLMCSASEEGRRPGLGWIDAKVKRFRPPADSALKVPHMGWNTVAVRRANALLPLGDDEQRFYFVHSYYVACNQPDDVLATTSYGGEFAAAVNARNVFGVQFHPEKSHRFGMALMRNFVTLAC